MRTAWSSSALFAGLLMVGCNPPAVSTGGGAKTGTANTGEKARDHSGWWCVEHGVPELECSMCQSKAAKEFKAKGDWCDKHERAKSQCFICDPSLMAKYAAKYEAKYGKQPPEPEDNMPEKK